MTKKKIIKTKDQAIKVKHLSELYWESENTPRAFTFSTYYKELDTIIKVSKLIRKHKAFNLRIAFDNFRLDQMPMISIGSPVGAVFSHKNSWPYNFTENLLKDLIKILGNLTTYIEIEDTDGVGYKINKDLEVMKFWLPSPS